MTSSSWPVRSATSRVPLWPGPAVESTADHVRARSHHGVVPATGSGGSSLDRPESPPEPSPSLFSLLPLDRLRLVGPSGHPHLKDGGVQSKIPTSLVDEKADEQTAIIVMMA